MPPHLLSYLLPLTSSIANASQAFTTCLCCSYYLDTSSSGWPLPAPCWSRVSVALPSNARTSSLVLLPAPGDRQATMCIRQLVDAIYEESQFSPRVSRAAWLAQQHAMADAYVPCVSQSPSESLNALQISQIMDELASQFSFSYEVKTADIDEKAIRYEDPHQLVLALARAKRDAIMVKLNGDNNAAVSRPNQFKYAAAAASGPAGPFLITCDQVVLHQGRILEKPESSDECREYIRGYGTASASTVGSVMCTDLSTGKSVEAVDVSHIHFRPIPETIIDKLIEEGQCMWCAGGLMVEHPLVVPYVERIDGTEDGVKGLAKALVLSLLLEAAGL